MQVKRFGCRLPWFVLIGFAIAWTTAVAQAQKPSSSPSAEFPWLGSKEGFTDRVLPPWTSMRVQKAQSVVVECWGREYEFTGQPFLARVKTGGRSIFSGPMRVVARVNGLEQVWQTAAVRVKLNRPDRVRLSQESASADLMLSLDSEIEYDGMIRINWRVLPRRPVRLDELTLEISFSNRYAKYLYSYPYGLVDWFTYPGERRPGEIPREGSTGSFVPFLWVGDEERGIAWFCESNVNWFNADANKATEILRKEDCVLLRFHLVTAPVDLAPQGSELTTGSSGKAIHELSYTVGFQATPVKPVAKDCWDYRIVTSPSYGKDYAMLAETAGSRPMLDHLARSGVRTLVILNWTDVLCYTNPVGHSEDLRKLVKACHGKGIKVVPYFGFQVSELAPEWPLFREKAVRVFQGKTPRGPDQYAGQAPQMMNAVCYQSLWQDFLVDGIARLMDEYGVDGVYLDSIVLPNMCENTRHGCGRHGADGSVVGTHPIFAVRQTLKRIYTVVKTRKPEGIVDVHVPVMNISAVGWATSYWDGEQLRAFFSNESMIDRALPLDYFRTEFMGRQWGVPSELLHYTLFPHYQPGDYAKALAIALLHDVPVRAHASIDNLAVVSELWRVMDRFDRKHAKWIPYWSNDQYVTVQPAGAYASLYRHQKHGVLTVVANLSRDPSEVVVRINMEKLGLRPGAVVKDALTNEVIAFTDSKICLGLPSLGWRIVWVR